MWFIYTIKYYSTIERNEVRSFVEKWMDLETVMEKAMATHSSSLAWRIPGMGQPGGLPSMGSHRVGHH